MSPLRDVFVGYGAHLNDQQRYEAALDCVQQLDGYRVLQPYHEDKRVYEMIFYLFPPQGMQRSLQLLYEWMGREPALNFVGIMTYGRMEDLVPWFPLAIAPPPPPPPPSSISSLDTNVGDE